MLTRAQKQEQIDTLRGMLAPANGLFVMDFTGLSVGEVTELRRRVKEARGNYRVVRNTLARLALAETDHRGLEQLLTGPAAVAYTDQDAVMLAKALAEFAKTHEQLRFRGGLVEGQLLDAQQAQAGSGSALQEGAGGEAAVPAAVADAQAGNGVERSGAGSGREPAPDRRRKATPGTGVRGWQQRLV